MVGPRFFGANHPPNKRKKSTPRALSIFKHGPPCVPDALFSQTHQLVRSVKEILGEDKKKSSDICCRQKV